jgi:hypothetical protein
MIGVCLPGWLYSTLADSGERVVSNLIFRQVHVDQVITSNHGASQTLFVTIPITGLKADPRLAVTATEAGG